MIVNNESETISDVTIEEIKVNIQEYIAMESGFSAIRNSKNPIYWRDLITTTEGFILLQHFVSLDKWELDCMLMEKGPDSFIYDKVTQRPLQYQLLDICFCECFRNLKLLTDASLISVYPDLDKSWTHPLRMNHSDRLYIRNDEVLWKSISNGHEIFSREAGYSMCWKEIKKWPPLVFLVPYERKKREDPDYASEETELVRTPKNYRKRAYRKTPRSQPKEKTPPKKRDTTRPKEKTQLKRRETVVGAIKPKTSRTPKRCKIIDDANSDEEDSVDDSEEVSESSSGTYEDVTMRRHNPIYDLRNVTRKRKIHLKK
jgi:hypothetical protein